MKKIAKTIIRLFLRIYYRFISLIIKSIKCNNYLELLYNFNPIPKMFYQIREVKSNEDILLSIIITSYNKGLYIEEALNSIFKANLDFDKIEIIIIDNKSTDNTIDIINEYKTNLKYKILVIKNEKNYGPGFSRNKGIEESCGKYFMFLDADDKLVSNKFVDIIDLCYLNYDFIQLGYNGLEINEGKYFKQKEIFTLPGFPWGKMINRNAWGNLSFPINCNWDDTIFRFGFFEKCHSVYVSSEISYWYRRSPLSISHKINQSFFDIVYLVPFLYDKLIEKNDFTYTYLILQCGSVLYNRTKHFSTKTQIASFTYTFVYISNIKKSFNLSVTNNRIRKLENAILNDNFYKWKYLSLIYNNEL